MAAVVGYLIAASVATLMVWAAADRGGPVARDRSIDLAELGGRHVSIVGGLAGFAVTGMVLIVTLGRSLPDASGTPFTTLLTMFFVAYMGFFATSVQFANIADADPSDPFDVPGAAFAGAAVTLFFTVAIGWFALRLLFETFGLVRLADLAGVLLPISSVAAYGLLATHLSRSGFASTRVIAIIPIAAIVGMLLYALAAAMFGLRSSGATLSLIVTAFVLGAPVYALLTAGPFLARQPRLAPALATYGRRVVLGYAQGAATFVGFLLLGVWGLA
jgi:hypothetical protein